MEFELSLVGSFRNWEGRIESSVIRMGALFYINKNINKLEEQNLLAIFFDQDFRELTLYCETRNFVKLKRVIFDINARVDRNDQNKRAQVAAAVAAAKVPRFIAADSSGVGLTGAGAF